MSTVNDSLYFATNTLKNKREVALASVKRHGESLEHLSVEFRNDPEIVMAAVQENGDALKYASGDLKKNPEIVMAAVQRSGTALTYASGELRSNREIVLTAVQQNGYALYYASPDLRNDREVVLAAVRRYGEALCHASDACRNDREIVLTAVQQDGRALEFAPVVFRDDREIAQAAVQQSLRAFQYVPDDLKNDRDFILKAVQSNAHALYYASDELKNDRELVMTAVQQSWHMFDCASEDLKNDPEFVQFVEEEKKKKKQSATQTQVLNFMWINLDLPAKPDPEDGSIRMPLPEEYIGSIRTAGLRHPQADIHLWLDSRRVTQKQWDYLEARLEDGVENVHVKDLCSIPEYINEELYSRPETNKNWRLGYQGVVWLQIDAAKILISLQGDYDQHFFADLDHAHVDIGSEKVQKMINDHGLMIGSAGADTVSVENQLWGFDRSRKHFFEEYYTAGLQMSYCGEIAYCALPDKVLRELCDLEELSQDEFCLPIDSIGLAHAEEPGHEWSSLKHGRSIVPDTELCAIFAARSQRKQAAAQTAPIAPRLKLGM